MDDVLSRSLPEHHDESLGITLRRCHRGTTGNETGRFHRFFLPSRHRPGRLENMRAVALLLVVFLVGVYVGQRATNRSDGHA